MKIHHFMLDLETLDTSKTAHILEIALVKFDPFTGRVLDTHQFTLGGLRAARTATVSASTVAWWMNTDPTYFATFFDKNRTYDKPDYVCRKLEEIFVDDIAEGDSVRLWCTGSFDTDILGSFIANNRGGKSFIRYNWARDVRSMRAAAQEALGIDYVEVPTTHRAVEDCVRQIKYVSDVYKALYDGRTREDADTGDKGRYNDVPAPAKQSDVD